MQLAVDAPWRASFFDPQVFQQLSVAHYTSLVRSNQFNPQGKWWFSGLRSMHWMLRSPNPLLSRLIP